MSEPASTAPSPPRRRRRLPLKKKLLFASVLVLGSLLLLEGGLRLAGWPTQRIRSIGKVLNLDGESFKQAVGVFRPGLVRRVSWPPELAYEVQINSLGLRGPEISRERSAGAPRILALGDSTTFGFYVENQETWPAQLERWLAGKLGKQVEVANGGCGGWSIDSSTGFAQERGLQLSPDLVVLSFCSNDIKDLERPLSPYEGLKQAQDSRGAWKELYYSTATYELALRVKIAWKRYRQKRKGEVPHPLSSVDLSQEQVELLWAKYEEWLKKLQDTLRQRKIPLVVIYQPDPYKFREGLPPDDQDRLAALCTRLEIPFCSTLEPFEGHPPEEVFHLPLDGHPSPLGYRFIAETTGQFLLERGLLD